MIKILLSIAFVIRFILISPFILFAAILGAPKDMLKWMVWPYES